MPAVIDDFQAHGMALPVFRGQDGYSFLPLLLLRAFIEDKDGAGILRGFLGSSLRGPLLARVRRGVR